MPVRNLTRSDWRRFFKLNRMVVPYACFTASLLVYSAFHPTRWLVPVYGVVLYAGMAVLNDIADVDIDRESNPDRPIPQDRITVSEAYRLAGALILGGVIYAGAVAWWYARPLFLAFPIIHLLLGYLYVKWFSRHFLAGTVLLSVTHGLLPFTVGLFLFGQPDTQAAVFGGSTAVTLALTYVIKDFKDISGDAGHRTTLITRYGVEKAKKITAAAFATVLPVLLIQAFGQENALQIAAGAVAGWIGLMVLVYGLFRSRTEEAYEQILDMYRFVVSGTILLIAVLV